MLAVDPATLPGTAYWRDEFADRSLPDLLTALAGPATGGRLPAIVVDPRGELGRTADVRLGHQHRPGSRPRRPPRCSRAGGCRSR